MIRKGLTTEIWWFVGFLVSFSIVGAFLGYFSIAAILGAMAYVGRVLYYFQQLEKWMVHVRRDGPQPHELPSFWGEIAEDVILMQKRMDKDKGRLQSVVERIQEMTSALTDGIILLNHQGNIEWWNAAAKRLLNFQPQDQGQKLTNLIRTPRFIEYFEKQAYSEPLNVTLARREDLYLQFQIHPFGQGDRLVVLRDISRVHKLEQMRKDFVANVSHELRTPLTVVRGYLETLEDSPKVPPVWLRAIEQMQQQVKRMSALVNDLITLTKLETDDRETPKERVNIASLVATIISDAKVLSGDKNHTFHQRGDSSLEILGSERELRSAFSNLVFNAVHYSPNDAEICVEYDVLGQEYMVTVIDSGPGIDPKHIPRLTERFYRVDGGRATVSGGTGLGLAIVKHVLLRHEANLTITSKLGTGSRFSCHFPLDRVVSESAA